MVAAELTASSRDDASTLPDLLAPLEVPIRRTLSVVLKQWGCNCGRIRMCLTIGPAEICANYRSVGLT